MRIRVDRLIQRRREVGVSIRELARRVGLTQTLMKSVETAENHPAVTLGQVEALADALAVDPDWLLDIHLAPVTESEGPPGIERLGALLTGVDDFVPIAALAEATGLSQREIDQRLQELDHKLRPCGMRLMNSAEDRSVRITDDPTHRGDPDEFKALLRATSARRQLDRTSARIVYGALTGKLTAKAAGASNHGRTRLGRLYAAGVVVPAEKETAPLQLSEEARESLRA